MPVVSVTIWTDNIRKYFVARAERCGFCGNTAIVRICLAFVRDLRSGIRSSMVMRRRRIFVPGSDLCFTPYSKICTPDCDRRALERVLFRM